MGSKTVQGGSHVYLSKRFILGKSCLEGLNIPSLVRHGKERFHNSHMPICKGRAQDHMISCYSKLDVADSREYAVSACAGGVLEESGPSRSDAPSLSTWKEDASAGLVESSVLCLA